MGTSEWTAMALLAAAVVIGSVGSAVAFQVAPPAVLAPFNFAYVALWGVLLFQEQPSNRADVGMLLIVLAEIGAARPPKGTN